MVKLKKETFFKNIPFKKFSKKEPVQPFSQIDVVEYPEQAIPSNAEYFEFQKDSGALPL